MKSYADEIDNLSMHGVDPDMLDSGAGVARSFRQISLRISHGHQDVSAKNQRSDSLQVRHNDRRIETSAGKVGFPGLGLPTTHSCNRYASTKDGQQSTDEEKSITFRVVFSPKYATKNPRFAA